ncbi:heptaprenyl diphosphate synthase component I [[Clostridium] sordellii]|uniref:Gx transporter family protein n=1 Tax=Paraclostridium sordellii TaxID=1505 RepID=UPI0005EA09A5|nr:Gx transporter family protein [Paeniclostridium sordellii]CEQ31585.1 heptaprenyl diphosphate synthase component I [[Clostridium] sordellii] [Paeniclostridium sordellii]
MNNNLKKTIRLSALSAIALTIFIIEIQIPPLVPIPGIKLGLANIITLIILSLYGIKEASAVLFIRIFLGSIFSGQMINILYSLSGGILCLVVMSTLMKLLGKKNLCFISITGAIAHNIGQITVSMIILETTSVLYYLPILLISGVITGAFTGIVSKLMVNNVVLKKLINEEMIHN